MALAEQSEFWRKNLARLVAEGVGAKLREPWTYDERDQFRYDGVNEQAAIGTQ